MDKHSKIYIAGHTGLLGSNVYEKLKTDGYENLLVRPRNELDLTQQAAVFDFFENEKPEYVFLCAGLNGGIIANKTYPADFFHVNISIQDNVFEAALKSEVKHLIFYGSSCMYPRDAAQPIKEDSLLRGQIETTSEAYALAKMAGVIACRSCNKQYKNNRFIVFVPNTMFGPHDHFDPDNSHVLSALIYKFDKAKKEKSKTVLLWGSGEARREFIYVDDVAAASLFALQNEHCLENIHYNLGNGQEYSIRELAQKVADVVGYNGQIIWDKTKPDGAKRKLLDSTKFRRIGWRPKVSLEDGLVITYKWFVNNN